MAVHSGPRPFFSTPPPSFKHYNLTYLKRDQLLLKKITFNRGEIDISYTDRVDIAAADWEPKAKKIDRLTVKNISGDRVLDVRFGHSYLGTVVGNPEHADHREREQTALNCRLLLDKISIFRNNGELNRNYVFSYNRNPLPPKNSSSTDHWGYYNVNSRPFIMHRHTTELIEIPKDKSKPEYGKASTRTRARTEVNTAS